MVDTLAEGVLKSSEHPLPVLRATASRALFGGVSLGKTEGRPPVCYAPESFLGAGQGPVVQDVGVAAPASWQLLAWRGLGPENLPWGAAHPASAVKDPCGGAWGPIF